uniref:Uncharacterized protein n=1 Tax=Knipowitschia caucasica TaxID=637954 RepID=A0AAV2MMH6_KNICA
MTTPPPPRLTDHLHPQRTPRERTEEPGFHPAVTDSTMMASSDVDRNDDHNPSEMDALCPSPPSPSRPQRNYERMGERTGTTCKDCIASGKAGDIDVSVDKGKWYQKLADTHTESPQTALESNDWKEFLPSNIPPLYNYGYVYHWLVESLPTLPQGLLRQKIVMRRMT